MTSKITIGGILAALKLEVGLKYSQLIMRLLTPGFSSFKLSAFREMTGDGPGILDGFTIESFDQKIKESMFDSFPVSEKKEELSGNDYDYRGYLDIVCRCAVKLGISFETVCGYTPLILDSMLSAMNEQEKNEQYWTAVAAIQNRIAQNKDNLSMEDLIIIE